ncbi:hypothetical protein Tco_0744464, partial [Tanacetum coccineum]
MYGFKDCSSCGALYNREHCCSNVSSVDNFVRDPNPISYDETPDSSQQPPRNWSKCGGPFGGLYCRQCTCERCRRNYTDEVCGLCCYEVEKSFVNDSNSTSFIDSPNIFYPPSQPQYQTNSYLQIISDELAEYINSLSWNCPAFYDDDDEYTAQYREYLENSSKAITPILPTEEPDNSLSMGDEHLSIILETKTDKLIKSSVENLVPIPSESEDFSLNESECDVPVCDDFTTFSNPLFDSDDDFSSSDDDRDILTVSYPKIDYLLEEFFGELTHINLIPPGINEADFDPKEEICLIEELLYDNSSPRPPEESNSENSDATIKSSSPSPIPIEDSYSLMEEVNLFLDPDDSIPPGIESDNYDSEGDILFLKELLSNDSLLETELFHFVHYDVSTSPCPPTKPPDDGIFFNIEPDQAELTSIVIEDILGEPCVHVPNVLPTHPTLMMDSDYIPSDDSLNPGIFFEVQSMRFLSRDTFSISCIRNPLYPVIETLVPFSSENEGKV